MKKLFTSPWTYVGLAVLAIVIFHKKIAAWWNSPKEGDKCTYAFEPAFIEGVIRNGKCERKGPAEGSACSLNGQAGTIVNGTCVPVVSAQRVILVPISSSRIGSRRARCYSKPLGAMCEPRIFDSILGWGTLYNVTGTTCCYIFR